jgi:hypothetical protein
MIMPIDEDYKQTKRIKKTGIPFLSPFKELADWVSANYSVHVLNVVYDKIKPDDEFGYLQKRGVSVHFDSKQNFDTNFKSNWYYYYL